MWQEEAILKTAIMKTATVKTALVKMSGALALLAVAALPDARGQEMQSFKTIIGKGYDIKAVTFARGESTDNREAFIITLQKEKSVAVCYFAAASWVNLSPPVLDDSKRCDVR